jgi:hypothetical protein
VDNVRGRVGLLARLEVAGNVRDVVSGGNEGWLRLATMDLSETDGGKETIADALSAFRVGRIAAFLFVQFNGLGRAAVANLAIFLSVKLAQVTEVAHALSPGFDFGFGNGPGHF